MNSIFNKFKSEKPKSTVLGIGDHIVKVLRVFNLDSFTNADGSAKDESKWSEATPQGGVLLGNDKGVITHRLNGLGFLHTDQINPDEMEEQGLVDVDGFVAKELEDGKFERIPSETNTEACKNILNKFMQACSIPLGTSWTEFMQLAADNEIELKVIIKQTEYDGKTHNEVAQFKLADVKEPEADLA